MHLVLKRLLTGHLLRQTTPLGRSVGTIPLQTVLATAITLPLRIPVLHPQRPKHDYAEGLDIGQTERLTPFLDVLASLDDEDEDVGGPAPLSDLSPGSSLGAELDVE